MTPEIKAPRSKRRIGILHNHKFFSEVFTQTRYTQHYSLNLDNQTSQLEPTKEITMRIKKKPRKKKKH